MEKRIISPSKFYCISKTLYLLSKQAFLILSAVTEADKARSRHFSSRAIISRVVEAARLSPKISRTEISMRRPRCNSIVNITRGVKPVPSPPPRRRVFFFSR